jgi:hypothetical protein
MKRIISAVSLVMVMASMAMAGMAKASPRSYNGTLANETGLAYSTTYTLDLAQYDADRVSAVVSYGTATFAASTFTDGSVSTGNITVVSTTALAGTILTINRISFIAGTDYAVALPTETATNLAAAINGNTQTAAIISAQAIGSVVYATSTLVGGNFPLATSSAALLSISGANMTGGTGAYYSAATDIINVPSHGFTLGLPLLYSGTPAISGILTGTTYYALPIDSNNVYLSTTSALAISGSYINLTNQHANATAATYTLAPLAITGTPGIYWQESNDNVNYFSVNTSSVSISTTAVASYSNWDFSDVNYRYLRLNVAGPTTGAIILKAVMNAKMENK